MKEPRSDRTVLRRVIDVANKPFLEFDHHLDERYPRLRVLRLHKIVPLTVVLTLIAGLHGYLTPGAPHNLSRTDNITTIWFVGCCAIATYWSVLQWEERERLPKGCKAGFAWSPASNCLCLVLLFLPAVVYSYTNSAAIRRLVPLEPILSEASRAQVVANRAYLDARTSRLEGKPVRPFPVSAEPVVLLDYPQYKQRPQCSQAEIYDCLRLGMKIKEINLRESWCKGNESLNTFLTVVKPLLDPTLHADFCAEDEAKNDHRPGAWNAISQNLRSLLKAHGVEMNQGVFRGPNSLLALLMFLMLVSVLLSLSSTIPWRYAGLMLALGAGLFAFAQTFKSVVVLVTAEPVIVNLKLLSITVPVLTTLSLVLARARTRQRDIIAVSWLLSGLFFLLIWWALRGGDFYVYSSYGSNRIEPSEGCIWATTSAGLYIVLSPGVMWVIDRYRNYPSK